MRQDGVGGVVSQLSGTSAEAGAPFVRTIRRSVDGLGLGARRAAVVSRYGRSNSASELTSVGDGYFNVIPVADAAVGRDLYRVCGPGLDLVGGTALGAGCEQVP